MGRIGQNPIKIAGMLPPAKKNVTVTTIVYVPDLVGYWKDSLEVLEIFFRSMRASTDVEFDLMVFDNASCKAVKTYLENMQERGDIQFLVRSSVNYGKDFALNHLMGAAPGDIVSYADSDVYFMHDWLAESVKIVNAFPKAGMVTAQPIVGGDLRALTAYKDARDNGSAEIVSMGHIIDEQYNYLRAVAIARKPYPNDDTRCDVLLRSNGVCAFVGSSHFQFTVSKGNAKRLFPIKIKGLLKGDGVDVSIDENELWRLCTEKYLVHHIGNNPSDYISELSGIPEYQELNGMKSDDSTSIKSSRNRNTPPRRLTDNNIIRRICRSAYTRLFHFLYD